MTSGQGAELPGIEDLVTEQNLANRLFRPLTDTEKAAVPDLLADALEEIRGRVPALTTRWGAGLVTAGQLRKVLVATVARVLANPNAIRQYTVDDGTLVRDQAVSAGLLYVTDDDIALLSGTTTGDAQQHISLSVPYR